jgi:hypothetical protein
LRDLTPEQVADGKRHVDRFEEFKRLSRLNENIGDYGDSALNRTKPDKTTSRFSALSP